MHLSNSSPDGPRSEVSRLPGALTVPVGPIGENRLWRWLRWRKDRRCLLKVDARLLIDSGLTREDVLRGVPFGPVPAQRSPGSHGCEGPGGSRMRRSGLLTGGGWQVKLYLSDDPRALGAGDANAAARAFRACLADPGGGPALGFAVLRYCLGEERAPEGSVALVVWSWAGQVPLSRRNLPSIPPRRGRWLRLASSRVGLVEGWLQTRWQS